MILKNRLPFYLDWREEPHGTTTSAAPLAIYIQPGTAAPLEALTAWLSRPCKWKHRFKNLDSERICCTRCFNIWRKE